MVFIGKLWLVRGAAAGVATNRTFATTHFKQRSRLKIPVYIFAIATRANFKCCTILGITMLALSTR
jgi:hypothetical protein